MITLFHTIGNIEIRGWYAAADTTKRRASIVCHKCQRGAAFETTQAHFDASASPVYYSLQCLETTLEFLQMKRGCSHAAEAFHFLQDSRQNVPAFQEDNRSAALRLSFESSEIQDLFCFDSKPKFWRKPARIAAPASAVRNYGRGRSAPAGVQSSASFSSPQ